MGTPNPAIQRVTSKDGTTIGFDRQGDGLPIILISGGSVDRTSNASLAANLASDLTAINYDRRGRGDSGDTLPYAIEREVEDIDAVVTAAGGSAYLYGSSSGAALGLIAADVLGPDRITRLAMWEPPYFVDPSKGPPTDHIQQYDTMIAEGRPGDAAEYFMTKVVGMPADFVIFAKTQPWWANQVKIAPTLAYDGRIMNDYALPLDRAARVAVPTIVLAGGASFPFLPETAKALVKAFPNGTLQILEGQSHDVSADALGPALKAFLAG
jgi:pimeloyl-ACP methyl ester carboxylesterase